MGATGHRKYGSLGEVLYVFEVSRVLMGLSEELGFLSPALTREERVQFVEGRLSVEAYLKRLRQVTDYAGETGDVALPRLIPHNALRYDGPQSGLVLTAYLDWNVLSLRTREPISSLSDTHVSVAALAGFGHATCRRRRPSQRFFDVREAAVEGMVMGAGVERLLAERLVVPYIPDRKFWDRQEAQFHRALPGYHSW